MQAKPQSIKVWVPSIYVDIVADLITDLCTVCDGCTVYDAQGYWMGKGNTCEHVKVVEAAFVGTSYAAVSALLRQYVVQLLDAGEECVMYSVNGIGCIAEQKGKENLRDRTTVS